VSANVRSTRPVVLDSFAVLCFFEKQPGWEQVRALLRELSSARRRAIVSLINLGEIYYIVAQRQGPAAARLVVEHLARLPIEIAPVDRPLTLRAAEFKSTLPVSYADAFCLATAEARRARVMTGDPEFRSAEALVDIVWLPQRRPRL